MRIAPVLAILVACSTSDSTPSGDGVADAAAVDPPSDSSAVSDGDAQVDVPPDAAALSPDGGLLLPDGAPSPPDGAPPPDAKPPPPDAKPPPPDAKPPPPDAARPPPDAAPPGVIEVCAGGGGAFESIADAIAAAAPGATIEVCPGTYREQLAIGKSIHLLAVDGAGTTIIDAGGDGPAIAVVGTGPTPVVVEGFTVRGGAGADRGGGILCETSALTVVASVIADNSAADGGGLYAADCEIHVIQTTLSGNAGAEWGGGAMIQGGAGVVSECTFWNNAATRGAGLAIVDADVAVRDSELSSNAAGLQGGGLYHGSDAVVERNLIANNDSGWTAGGVYVAGHAPVLRDNVVSGNTSVNDGGGIYVHQSAGSLEDNQVLDNFSGDDGGGIRIFESLLRVERNLIDGNEAGDAGGGVRISHLPGEFYDNIVTDNRAYGTGGGFDLDNDASIIRGGVISDNNASVGGGIHAWLFPWAGGEIGDVVIADNNAWRGGGLFLQHNFQPVVLEQLTVRGNTAGHGAGLYVRTTSFTLHHSTFSGNDASHEGGAILVGGPGFDFTWPCPCPPDDATGAIDFIVAHGNSADEGGAVLWSVSPSLSLANSIMVESIGVAVVIAGGAVPDWSYNDTHPASFGGMGDPTGGDGNIEADPLFVDPGAGDFALSAGSPAIDAADPAFIDTDGTRADMGVFGGLGDPW